VAELAGSAAGRLTDGQAAVLRALAAGPVPAADLPLDHGGLRRLADRGVIVLERRDVRRRPSAAAVGAASAIAPVLTPAQTRVAERIERALAAAEPTQFLLHGVTGSGKTEVYLRAAGAALAAGRGAIVLVPEIALTPQTVTRFRPASGTPLRSCTRSCPPASVTTSGGGCAPATARICVGPRSAVFAPVGDLGPRRGRRGARRVLQARGRPALRRPRRRRPAARQRRRCS
jgi:primosomal protein N' (replication factor Y)